MDDKEIIKNLTQRIEILEKAERKRIIKRRIAIFFRLIKLVVLIVLVYYGYNYVNDKYINPYKEKIENINEKINKVEGSVGNVQKYFNN